MTSKFGILIVMDYPTDVFIAVFVVFRVLPRSNTCSFIFLIARPNDLGLGQELYELFTYR